MTTTENPGIVLVPHTHWDREWYEPFQVFRHRLVDALDRVLDMAEADHTFRFTLDGQTAAIEDYLEIRPQHLDRVRAAVRRGQLALGPWLILLDEFLCTGETIVRNLQLGWAGAERLGGAMDIGYLPDMFGHIAQMPQILARAGIRHAAFWRGVPGSVTGHAFRWVAPDGSSVRAEYLFDGYGNALDVLLVPDEIPRALRDYRALTRSRWGADPILGMVGTDHMAPRADLMDLVRRFDSPDFPITVATLGEYIHGLPDDGDLTRVHGELRSHARGNILPGVVSIRRRLKDAMAEAERVVGEAERVSLGVPLDRTAPFLDLAWRDIVESSAHDSVVGSGTDETVEQVASRLAEAAQLGRAVRDQAVSEAALEVPSDAILVVNTLTSPRTIVVETDVAAPSDGLAVSATLPDGRRLPVQESGRAPVVLGDEVWEAADVERVLRRIHRRELFGQEIDRYEIVPGGLTFWVAQVPSTPAFDLLALRSELRRAVDAHPGPWNVRTLAEPRRSVLIPVLVGASGSTAVRIAQDPGDAPGAPPGPVPRASGSRLDNGLVSVEVLPDGTFDVRGQDGTVLHGVGRLVDGGDRGDSYNYGPPAFDRLVEAPASVEVRVVESGPVRAAVEIDRRYGLPTALSEDPDRRSDKILDMPVRTRVELRAGEPFARVSVSFVNVVADHRLRLHVPLPRPASHSSAEGQFSVTDRGLTNEGGWGEFPIPTYPATGFVSSGDATVLLRGATEYELAADGAELAVTLLRSVGSISVNVHPLRDEPAASQIPIPGGRELGSEINVDLAILPSAGGWRAADTVRWAEHFRSPGLWRHGSAEPGAALPPARSGIEVSGRGVHVSALRAVPIGVELRIVAMTPEPTVATVAGPYEAATTVDLLGRPIERLPAASVREIPLQPWEIRTFHLS
ncbi:alpha-mannosidase [Planotetraspora sp. GP83]|uniref:glycoside hydrolase family 38 N-terminal domain-containing protein n=1 Tax=Planotetraspora sp. GP83 TaxID=3156264 RepID=UPI0035157EC5